LKKEGLGGVIDKIKTAPNLLRKRARTYLEHCEEIVKIVEFSRNFIDKGM
jgi:hypothetical protein